MPDRTKGSTGTAVAQFKQVPWMRLYPSGVLLGQLHDEVMQLTAQGQALTAGVVAGVLVRRSERLCGYGNDMGLLAEQVDPSTGQQLGNFPRAFSHVGLVKAALNLGKASAGAR